MGLKKTGAVLWFRIGCVSLLGAWLVYSTLHRGPVVDGLTLDQWLAHSFYYEDGAYRGYASEDFNRAIQEMGTNAIPRLLSKLRTKELPGAPLIMNLVGAKSYSEPISNALGLNRAAIQRQRAVYGFKALGALGTNAIPALLELPWGFFMMEVFDGMGTAALPHLLEPIRTGRMEVKLRAMGALEAKIYDIKREEIVAIWSERLQDEDRSVRLYAARLIGNAKPARAQAALPALQIAAKDPIAEVAEAAQEAIGKLRQAP